MIKPTLTRLALGAALVAVLAFVLLMARPWNNPRNSVEEDRTVQSSGFIDAHVHVWSSDIQRYPLASGRQLDSLQPPTFTPEELLRHTKPAGVARINLVQPSCYGFDNSYMLDVIAAFKGTFAGTAVIDPERADVDKEMTELGKKGVRSFRIHPGLAKAPPGRWLQSAGHARMFEQAARTNQALACLIDPDGLPEVDRMCRKYPNTSVVIDHLARIGASGSVDERDVQALCAMAQHPRVFVKVGAFYALGKKAAPYQDLAGLIERVVKAFGPERCMWESDSPYQVVGGHAYSDSFDLVRSKLTFLSENDREWLLRKTAEMVLFTP